VVKVSPSTHIVLNEHIEEDTKRLHKKLGTTARGIAPCYSEKSRRTGVRAKDVPQLRKRIWDGNLKGKVLCEGAQGFWLDLDWGNYPYVTSSTTMVLPRFMILVQELIQISQRHCSRTMNYLGSQKRVLNMELQQAARESATG
jgi:adenylosuccinate synthase